MAKRLKEEYQNSTVVVRNQFGRKVTVDASFDPEVWSKVPEFEFLFEDEKKYGAPRMKNKPAPPTKPDKLSFEESVSKAVDEVIEEQKDEVLPKKSEKSLSDLSLKELRLKFPDIKATSKTGFLEQLGQA